MLDRIKLGIDKPLESNSKSLKGTIVNVDPKIFKFCKMIGLHLLILFKLSVVLHISPNIPECYKLAHIDSGYLSVNHLTGSPGTWITKFAKVTLVM